MTTSGSAPHSRALSASWRVLHIVLGLNALYALFIVVIFTALLVAPDATLITLGARADVDRSLLLLGMRVVAVLGLVGAIATQRILNRAIAIVATVRNGDPFVADNAHRLEDIAWTALLLQVLYLAIGATAAATSTVDQPFDIGWSFSLTPWVSVLLLFVLARVFAYGTRIRDDLDGVV